jgi:uncharacterized repeat protein (TIGR02543 family)
MAVLFGAGEASAAQLTLSWNDNSNGFGAFLIERSEGTQSEATFTAFAEVPAGVTSYVDTSVVEGVTYCYRVQAYNLAATSDYSNVACGAQTPDATPYTVSVFNSGWGTVTSSPSGIVCGSDCTETHLYGTVVMLTAIPKNVASTFIGWSGDCTGREQTCTITVTGPVSVRATFKEGNAP